MKDSNSFNVDKEMSKMLRLSNIEVEALRKKSIEINRKLIALSKEPMKDSELAHKIIELGLKNLIVNKYGELEM